MAQNQDPASTDPAPATPDLPAYELPSWSRFPQSTSHASATLQQLWLKCPDSFSLLLTPQHPRFPAHRQTAQDSAAQPADSREMTQPQSEALTQLAVQIQQHVQMLVCGSTSASASMLHDLITFLQTCQGHIARRHESSAPMSAEEREQQVSHQVPSDDSAPSGSAADRLTAAALHVTAALIAFDKACQQAVTSKLMKNKVNAQVPPSQGILLPLNAKHSMRCCCDYAFAAEWFAAFARCLSVPYVLDSHKVNITAFRLQAVINICVDSAHKKCCLPLAQIKQTMMSDVCALCIMSTAQQIIVHTLETLLRQDCM